MPGTRIITTSYTTTTPGRRADTSHLADYNDSFDVKLPSKLTENLTGVTAQIFPLPADGQKMQHFLDRYLNRPDPPGAGAEEPPVYFKPAAPFILLEVANYSRISDNIKNVGWFAQREIAFGMVLEWYARKGDCIEFLKYALIYPYVYVDNQLGIAGGREIYGWSKAPIQVALQPQEQFIVPAPLAPVFDVPTDELLLAADLLVPAGKPGAQQGSSKLIEIRQSRYFQAAGSAIADLLTAVPRAVNASLTAAWDLAKFFYNSPGYGTSILGEAGKVIPQYRQIVTGYLPSFITQTSGYKKSDCEPPGSDASIITLKEVREVDSTGANPLACYQGIVESTMHIERISDGGSLIDLTNPDPAAGICIDLYGQDGQPPAMLELGIQCQELKRSKSGTGPRVFRVAPFLPFWVKMNLKYGAADYQTWRTNWTGWTENNNPGLRDQQHQFRYIELGAGAPFEIPPPTDFPTVRTRVFPIPASKAVIDDLISRYLANTYDGKNSYFSFTSIGSFPGNAPKDAQGNDAGVVVAILIDFEGMKPADFDDFELTFAIPIKWTDNRTGHSGNSGTGLMHAFTFTKSYWNAITTAEVYGRSALKSTFEPAQFTALLPPKINDANLALTVKSEFFADGTKKQQAQELDIVEVLETFAPSPQPTFQIFSAANPETEAARVRAFLEHIGLTHLEDGKSFYSIALKQIRDASNTSKADYQASVWLQRTFTPIKSEFYEPGIYLRFFEYDNLSIPKTLGLITTGTTDPHCCEVKAIGPMFLQGSVKPGSTGIGWWNIANKWKESDFQPQPDSA